jgi:hypothetical protein
MSEKTSNNREFKHLKYFISAEAYSGRFTGHEVYIGSDSKVAERIWHKGGSTSRELYKIMLELRELALKFQFLLHLIHFAGTRLIHCGVDVFSRGEVEIGKLTEDIFIDLPLDTDPLSRSPSLLNCLNSWIADDLSIAQPSDWFTHAQQSHSITLESVPEVWVWSLPPAAALDALEEFGTDRLKRHDLLIGSVLVRTVMQPEWFKRFVKVTDMYFFVPAGEKPEWPANMHEALTSGLYPPSPDINPGTGQTSLSWVDWEALSVLCCNDMTGGWDLLRQFWQARLLDYNYHRAWCAPCYQQRLDTDFSVYHGNDPDSVPSPSEEKNYLHARPANSILCPFECDESSLYRLTGCPSQIDNKIHQYLLDCIRRAILDAFWSRSLDTLKGLRRMFKDEIQIGNSLGFKIFPTPMGPFPTHYDGGIRAAIGTICHTNRPGKHEAKQTYSSAHKARSVHANIHLASGLGGATSQAIRSDKGHQPISNTPTESEWFNHFMTGLQSRIGERRKQDAAISIALMIELQKRLELEWQAATARNDKECIRKATENGSFHVFTFCGSLRGFETPKLLIHDLRQHTLSPEESAVHAILGNYVPPHVSLPLSGRFNPIFMSIPLRTWG